MAKLEELIQEFCPNGVEYRNLENCCEILDNKRKPVTKVASRFKREYYQHKHQCQYRLAAFCQRAERN